MCEFSHNLSRGFACTLQPSPGQSHKAQQGETAEIEKYHSLWHRGLAQKGFTVIFSPTLSLEEQTHPPALAEHRHGQSLVDSSAGERSQGEHEEQGAIAEL